MSSANPTPSTNPNPADSTSTPPHIRVQLQHRAGPLTLDLAFHLTAPWTVLFGPSGSGKTTLMRAIAGLIRPDQGSIATATQVLSDTATRTFLPPHLRPVRSASQNARLFPHLSVFQNLAFGTTTPDINKSTSTLVQQAIARFSLEFLLQRTIAQLSGGERQRIAILRAAIAAIAQGSGTLLLLDEPFTGLDLAHRDRFLADLTPWLADHNIPVLSVTHDLGEAFQFGQQVLRIDAGKLTAQGPVVQVLAPERDRLLQQLHTSK